MIDVHRSENIKYEMDEELNISNLEIFEDVPVQTEE